MDTDQKLKSFGGNQRGRIILLGDGTEVLTDSDDTDMFDHVDEDKDLDSQVHKGQTTGHDATEPPAPSPDALPEKLDTKDPTYKAVAEKVLGKSDDSSEKKSEEADKDTKADTSNK